MEIDLGKISVDIISPSIGNDIICKNHYSKTVAKGVVYNIGIFYENKLYGVAQFGYGIMPQKTCMWVKGTHKDEYLELNRLWIDDYLGHNSESKSISLCIKYIKNINKKIKWIISFADGMMGKVGTIYQASNFIYTGYRKDGGIWMTKDCIRIHSVSLWHKHGTIKRDVLEGIYGTPLYKVFGGQFRYFYFLDKKMIKNLTVPILEYPKESDIRKYLNIKCSYGKNNDNYEDFINLLNSKNK